MPDVFDLRSPMPVPASDLAAWHFRPGAFQRLTPPWEDARVVAQTGPFADGTRWTIRAKLFGPAKVDWVAELFDVEPGVGFRDRQISGPFAAWVHTHEFRPLGEASELSDHVEYRLPLGGVGRLFGGGMARKRLAQMFAFRHWQTAADLTRHNQFHHRPRLTVAITGSRGLIGSELVPFLTSGGHRVVRLVTGKAEPPFDDGTTWVPWTPDEPIDPKTFEGVDAVVHLAGDGLADGRWTDKKMERIRSSRTTPTRHVATAAAAAGVSTLLSGSAIGIYGDRGDEEVSEESPGGNGFLADVCRDWEGAAEPMLGGGRRVVWVRTGIVLSPKRGALAKQLPAFRAGGGAVVGSGKQWVSWIGIGDTVGALYHLLMDPEVVGPVNLVAPKPVTQREFGRTLAGVLNRPFVLTAPGAALRLVFGKLADEALLAGQRVRPAKLQAAGFAFDRPDLAAELRFLLGR